MQDPQVSVKGAVTDVVESAVANPKAGIKTSELWLALIALADNLALAKWHTNIHLDTWSSLIIGVGNSALAGAYAWARTWLKAKHVTVPAAPPLV